MSDDSGEQASVSELTNGYCDASPELKVEPTIFNDSFSDAPVVKLVNMILLAAVHQRASDIYFESYREDYRVRYRIDGIRYETMKPPPQLRPQITQRLMVLANLDSAGGFDRRKA